MDFFKETDFETIVKYSGQEVDLIKFSELKDIYAKLKHLCEMLKEKGYEIEIRQDPRKQGGRSFKFQEYQWAKIFPAGMKEYCADIFSYIVGLSDTLHFHMMGLKDYQKTPASLAASKSCWTDIDIENMNYEDVVNQFIEFDKKNRNLFIKTGAALGISECITINNNLQMKEHLSLLKNKKQIILQGPPGTGKTRFAKELAIELCLDFLLQSSHKAQINSILTSNLNLKTVEGNPFSIENADNGSYKLKIGNGSSPYSVTTDQIIKVDNEPAGGASGKSYAKALATYVKRKIAEQDIELIQFHPAYSYEDFVRGISVKAEDGLPNYYSENKTLGILAAKALDNYEKSKMKTTELSKEYWVENKLDEFKFFLESDLEIKGPLKLTESVKLIKVEDDAFRYGGTDWGNTSRINFKDFIKLAVHNLERQNNLEINKEISVHGYYRKTYYAALLNHFFDKAGKYTPVKNVTERLRNFILIIDEINRANLPSVLGELIYALEYRGEPVKSIYKIANDSSLILPPNLLIIGTMNTADRSVGHIDYAIRRRFAFVDILPSPIPIKDHAKELFKAVSSLFVKNFESIDWANPILQRSDYLAADFRPEDVWLGHSYFITEDKDKGGDEQLKIKLDYEIRPLLKEYIKDGVLNESANLVIAELKANA